MKKLDSSKVYLAAALAGVAAVIAVAVLLLTRTEKQPLPRPKSEPETPFLAAPPPTAPPPAPPPVEAAAVGLPPPSPPVAPGAPPSAGEVTEMLVVARRIENTDPQRSRELLNKVLSTDPENAEALERLSKKLLTDENTKTAAELADRCLRVQPQNAQCAALKARIPPPPPPGPPPCMAQNPNTVECAYARTDQSLFDGAKENAAVIVFTMGHVAPDSPITKLADGRVKAAHGQYAAALPKFAAACALGNAEGCYRADLLRQEGW
jgi:hypothetical protein